MTSRRVTWPTLLLTVAADFRGTLSRVALPLGAAVLLLGSFLAGPTPGAVSLVSSYDNDDTPSSTTHATNTHAGVFRGYDGARNVSSATASAGGAVLATKEVDDGFVYLRTDKLGSKPYVGQSKSAGRYKARQTEHARDNPFSDFDYDILGRAEPGTALDRLEEFFIRGHGGPTTKRNPNGALANKRHQMSESR